MIVRVVKPRLQRGFTLIEMIAVVVLLGLISSTAVLSLSRADEAGALQSARWGIVNLDAQARLAARTEGAAVVVRSLSDGTRVSAHATPASNAGWSASFDCPRFTLIRFFEGDGGQELKGIFIDRTGRSADITVQVSNESGRSEQWFIRGLTGEISRFDSSGGGP